MTQQSLAQQITSHPTQFYSTAPVNATWATASATGNVTLNFPQVPSSQVFTGSVTIIPQAGGALPSTVWIVTRDGTTPFLVWYDNQVAIDVQAKDGQALVVTGAGLTPGQLVSAIWAGRNDEIGTAPVVAPSVAGAPSNIALLAALELATSLLATATNQTSQITQETSTAGNTGTANTYLGGTAPSAIVSAAGNTVGKEVSALIAGGTVGSTPGGAPLLRRTQNLGNGTAVNLPAATTTTLLGVTNHNQPGYEGVFSLNMPTNVGTVPFIQLAVIWTDSVTGLTVGQRSFFMTCGNASANALPFYISGPCRGNQVKITAQNLDPAVAATLTWGFNMTSHVYDHDRIQQAFFAAVAPNGYTNPSGTPSANVLLNSNLTPAASATLNRLTAAFGGRAVFFVNNTGTTAVHVYLADPVVAGNGLYGNANARYVGWNGTTLPAAGTVFAEVALPFGPFQLSVTNESTTAAAAVGVALVGLDY